MLTMTREDIQHLASLARIKLTEAELVNFENELHSILEYVGAVQDLAGDTVDTEPQIGVRYNVLRDDEVTNEPGQYTKDLIEQMPDSKDGFLKVKKILHVAD